MAVTILKFPPRAWSFALLVTLTLSSGMVYCQAPPATSNRATSTPYSGDLSIFETAGRDQRLQIQRVMDILGIREGSSVADIGAGSGWFTVRAAARVKSSGSVYAVDINAAAVDFIAKRAEREKLGNIHAIVGTEDDPKLPPDSVDVVLMLKAYHEIAHPEALLGHLMPALRAGARVGIIDRNGDGTDHGVMPDVVKLEMRQAGFHLVHTYDFTKADGQDYFLVFEKAKQEQAK